MVPGTTPEPLLLWFWMSLFVCWMVITALVLAAAFSASEQRRTRMLAIAATLLIVPFISVLVGWSSLIAKWNNGSVAIVASGMLVQLFGIVVFVGVVSLVRSLWMQQKLSRLLIANAMVVFCLSGHWIGGNLYEQLYPEYWSASGDETNFKLTPHANVAAFTDRGSSVMLFQCESIDKNYADVPYERDYGFSDRVMRISTVDTQANCHGWVFTQGKYLMRGNDVQKILTDNRYRRVPNPIPGDLIIYRDAFGNILHTGIVRYLNESGEPFIESKWGIQGHFLHRPQDQIYSQYYSYYHTERPSHVISIVKPAETELAAEWPSNSMPSIKTAGRVGTEVGVTAHPTKSEVQ